MAKPFTKFDGGGYPGLAANPGTRDGTKFLRDDGTWQNPGAGSVPGLNARFWVSDADAALPNGVDLSLLADGILRHTVSGGISTPSIVTIGGGLNFAGGTLSVPSVAARFWVSEASADLANEVNLGALASGVLQHTVAAGVSTPNVFASSPTRIPYGSAANGQLTETSLLNWNGFGLGVGGVPPSDFYRLWVENGVQATFFTVRNTVSTRYAGFSLVNDHASLTHELGMFLWGSAIGGGLPSEGAVIQNAGPGPMTIYNSSTTKGMCFTNVALGTIAADNTGERHVFNTSATASAGLTWDSYLWDTGTLTLSGATTVTTARFARFAAPVINGAGTVSRAATVSIAGAPSGTATITLPLALDVVAGSVAIGALGAGGLVKASVTNGVLQIASASDVAGAITWPTAGQVLVSSGTTTAPIGDAGLTYVTGTDTLSVGNIAIAALTGGGVVQATSGTGVLSAVSISGATIPFGSGVNGGLTSDVRLGFLTTELFLGAGLVQAWYNDDPPTNYERVRAFWSSNVWNLKSEQGGTGTVRAMLIGSTAGVTMDNYLQVNGVAAASNDAFAVGHTTSAGRDHVKFYVGGTQASVDNPNNEYVLISPANTTIDGFTTGILATVRINSLTYTGSSDTITAAASLYIANQPTLTSITGSSYAVWVDAGLSRFDGDGTYVFELPADFTGNTGAAIGRVPIKFDGGIAYLRVFED